CKARQVDFLQAVKQHIAACGQIEHVSLAHSVGRAGTASDIQRTCLRADIQVHVGHGANVGCLVNGVIDHQVDGFEATHACAHCHTIHGGVVAHVDVKDIARCNVAQTLDGHSFLRSRCIDCRRHQVDLLRHRLVGNTVTNGVARSITQGHCGAAGQAIQIQRAAEVGNVVVAHTQVGHVQRALCYCSQCQVAVLGDVASTNDITLRIDSGTNTASRTQLHGLDAGGTGVVASSQSAVEHHGVVGTSGTDDDVLLRRYGRGGAKVVQLGTVQCQVQLAGQARGIHIHAGGGVGARSRVGSLVSNLVDVDGQVLRTHQVQ